MAVSKQTKYSAYTFVLGLFTAITLRHCNINPLLKYTPLFWNSSLLCTNYYGNKAQIRRDAYHNHLIPMLPYKATVEFVACLRAYILVLPVWTSTKSELQEQLVPKNWREVSSWEVNQVWDIQLMIHKEGRKFRHKDVPHTVLWYSCGIKWPCYGTVFSKGASCLVSPILLSAWFAWFLVFVSGAGMC